MQTGPVYQPGNQRPGLLRVPAPVGAPGLFGSSPAIRDTIKLAGLAADTMSNILLQGESGTGKEVFAQAIHNHSSCCQGPFVAINCGAIPRELIGSELFGYVEGAFTGARKGGKAGKFEMGYGSAP